MIDVDEIPEIPKPEIEPLIDPEAPIDPNLSLPEPDLNVRPAPEVTSLDPPPADLEWPSSMNAITKKAESLNWAVRRGYARGWMDGRKRGTWQLRESACLWLYRADRTRLVFSWDRNPDSQAAGGPKWTTDNAVEFDARGMARAYGHMIARRML